MFWEENIISHSFTFGGRMQITFSGLAKPFQSMFSKKVYLYQADRYFVHFYSIKLWLKAVKSTGIWQMKMHSSPTHITRFPDSNNSPLTQIFAQNSTFWDGMRRMQSSTKWLIDSSGLTVFVACAIFFLCVFLKAAAFQKTLVGGEAFHCRARIGTKITSRPNNHKPNLAHCLNLNC